jgi:hypothetical protein
VHRSDLGIIKAKCAVELGACVTVVCNIADKAAIGFFSLVMSRILFNLKWYVVIWGADTTLTNSQGQPQLEITLAMSSPL